MAKRRKGKQGEQAFGAAYSDELERLQEGLADVRLREGINIDGGDDPSAVVRFHRPSEDGKLTRGVKFGLTYDERSKSYDVDEKVEPVEVDIEAVPITRYHGWLKEQSLPWLRKEALGAFGREFPTRSGLCLAGLLASQEQFDRMLSTAEVPTAEEGGDQHLNDGADKLGAAEDAEAKAQLEQRVRKLRGRLDWCLRLAAVPMLDDDYLVFVNTELPPNGEALTRLRRITQRREKETDKMGDENLQEEIRRRKEEKAAAKAAKTAGKEGGDKGTKEGNSPDDKEDKDMPASATTTQAPNGTKKKTAAKKTNGTKKAAGNGGDGKDAFYKLQKTFKPEEKVKYLGKNTDYKGKTVTVVSLEPHPAYGVRVKLGDKIQGVSPKSIEHLK